MNVRAARTFALLAVLVTAGCTDLFFPTPADNGQRPYHPNTSATDLPTPPSGPPVQVRVTGRVLSSWDGKPVGTANVTIELVARKGCDEALVAWQAWQTRSDDGGRFTLGLSAPQGNGTVFRFTVQTAGYETKLVTLAPSRLAAPVVLRVSPLATVTTHAPGPALVALANATARQLYATSAQDEPIQVPAGDWSVLVSAAGAVYPAQTVRLAPGARVTVDTIPLSADGNITGQTAPFASVFAFEHGNITGATRARGDGSFDMPYASRGTNVTLEARGRVDGWDVAGKAFTGSDPRGVAIPLTRLPCTV